MIDQEAHIPASRVVEHLNFVYQTCGVIYSPWRRRSMTHAYPASGLHANALMGTSDLGRVQGQMM